MELELEEIINHLTAKNQMKVQDIWLRLDLTRSSFQSWRRSSVPARKAELCEAIINAFPEKFDREQLAALRDKDKSMEKKILALMELTIEELKNDRDRLKHENENRLDEIEKQLKEIHAKLFGS